MRGDLGHSVADDAIKRRNDYVRKERKKIQRKRSGKQTYTRSFYKFRFIGRLPPRVSAPFRGQKPAVYGHFCTAVFYEL